MIAVGSLEAQVQILFCVQTVVLPLHNGPRSPASGATAILVLVKQQYKV